MVETKHRFHRLFPLTTVWGFNGTYPGPTIEAPKDVPVKVKWENKLPDKHLLPVDHTLHGTMDTPDVRTVVHLHGANVAADSDGNPEAWFSRDNIFIGPKYTKEVYEYTNHQAGATLWYHDHALGITRLNVYAGLAGFYLIRDHLEKRLNLPEGPYEIPIMIQDKTFNKDGSLFYPDNATPPVTNPIPSIASFFFGNTVVVNGKVWPYLVVEPRKYRFRILNASNTRAYNLKLSNGEIFHQIGTELGLLHHPVELSSFVLEPGERIDLIIDFSKYGGQEIILENTAQPLTPGMDQIMEFIVCNRLSRPDTSTIPQELMPYHKLNPDLAVKHRTLHLDETTDHYGRVMHLLNNRMWNDPATEKPKLDSIEISIIMHFKEHCGDYVWHCHILEHEDYDMMRPLVVDK